MSRSVGEGLRPVSYPGAGSTECQWWLEQ